MDVSPQMLQKSRERFGQPPVLGNTPAVRYWCGDCCALPTYQGSADAVFINAVFGNMLDEKAALQKASFLLKDGGHVVISHPLGSAHVTLV